MSVFELIKELMNHDLNKFVSVDIDKGEIWMTPEEFNSIERIVDTDTDGSEIVHYVVKLTESCGCDNEDIRCEEDDFHLRIIVKEFVN